MATKPQANRRKSFTELWSDPAPDKVTDLASALLSDPASLLRIRYAVLARFDCAEHPPTCLYWSYAGALGKALIDGLIDLAGDIDRKQDERREAYTLALQIAGRLSLGYGKLLKQDLSAADNLRAQMLTKEYHPGRNGAYDRLADVYRIILWHDKSEAGVTGTA
jgi:hypothetical protein